MSEGDTPVKRPPSPLANRPPWRKMRRKRTPEQEAFLKVWGPARKPGAERPSKRNPKLSPIESPLARILRSLKLAAWPHFPLGGYELDFALKDFLLDIEADGERYHSSLEAAAKRDVRDAWLKTRGYEVLRLTGSVILNDRELVIREIQKSVATASPRPKTRISDLEPKTLATFTATVSRLRPIREVPGPTGGTTKVRHGKLTDETGGVPLVLWGAEVDSVAVGNRVHAVDCWVDVYMGHLEVTTGTRGRIEKVPPLVAPLSRTKTVPTAPSP